MPSQRDIANKLIDEKRFSEALPILFDLIDADQADWGLFYMAGQCLRFTNNPEEATIFLNNAARLNPKEPSIFFALGIAYQLVEKYELAIDVFEYTIKLAPQLFTAYNSIGLTYRKIGNYDKALEWYALAAERLVSAVSDEVHSDREKCFKDEIVDGKKTLVLLLYAHEKTYEILQSEPMYSVLKNNIGVCLIELGRLEEARQQFMESIRFIPDGYEYLDPYQNLESIGF